MTRTLKTLASDMGIVIIAAVIIIGVYLIDTITPLGEPVRLLFYSSCPVLLSERTYAIPTVFVVSLLFQIEGLLVSPRGIAVSQAILVRSTFFPFLHQMVVTLIAIYGIRHRMRHAVVL